MTRDDDIKDTPRIICNSNGLETDHIFGLRQGARDYLVKPIEPGKWLEKIAALT